MSTWATARKTKYTLGVFLFFFIIIGVWGFFRFHKPETCSDGKQNQNEEGVDCGGICSLACSTSVLSPTVLWSRTFPIAHGFYNAVAFIENQNQNLGVKSVVYRFKLYDAENVLVAERVGKTFLLPNEKFAIFEPRINTGERIPKRTFFEFIQFSDWIKNNKENPKILVRGEKFSNIDIFPRVDAILQNGTVANISDIGVVAIVYDKNDNAMAVSSTKVDMLPADSSYNIAFTWDVPFSSSPSRVEIIPRVNLFDSAF
jgi:hypothetical protein